MKRFKNIIKLAIIFGAILSMSVPIYAANRNDMTVEDYLFDGEKPFGAEDMKDYLDKGKDKAKSWKDIVVYEKEEAPAKEKDSLTKDDKEKKAEVKDNVKLEEKKMYVPDKKDEWMLILVNKQNYVPDDYAAELVNVNGGMQVRKEVAEPLARMLMAAKEQDVSLMICSAYRSYERQTELFNRKINKLMGNGMSYLEAYRVGSYSVTIPGTSEHQLGMALDIVTPGYTSLDAGFANTEAGRWLKDNALDYGFILRYPKGKEHITGITFEPWHFRYVGEEAAKSICESGLTLEEYLEEIGMN